MSKKVEIYIFLVLIFSFLLISNSSLYAYGGKSEMDKINNLDKMQNDSSGQTISIERPAFNYDSFRQRDPFETVPALKSEVAKTKQPLSAKHEKELAPPNLIVQGVVWGGVFPQAIINSRVVKAGDNVEGAKIVAINNNEIVVLFANKEFILSPPAAGGTTVNTLLKED